MFIISGKIIKGEGIGKKLGFPTINLDRRNFSKLKRKPKFGVYYGTVVLDNKKYKAGIVIGPEDKRGLPKIEAHLLDFSGDAYGKKASIEVMDLLRDFKKFKNTGELTNQIKEDIKFISKLKI